MISCEEARGYIHPYVDGEVKAECQFALEAHLLECPECRAEYEAVRQVVDTVRGSKPLFQPSESLPLTLWKIVEDDRSTRWRRLGRRSAAMAACFAATVLLVALLPPLRNPRFTSFAADAHLRYANGSLPLGVVSERPDAVSDWLQKHLPFHLALPNYPLDSGEAKSYSLVGARLMRHEDKDVAYLAYTMNSRPISLLVASGSSVLPSQGETFTSGKLVFHFSSEKGLKLITWRDRGLSYALVSDLQVDGAQSCIVCHGGAAERDKFLKLSPEAD